MNTDEALQTSSQHDEIFGLLPWYINASLCPEDMARVKAHLGTCLCCRRELAQQAHLARRLNHEPKLEISAKPSFDRLMARIQSRPAPSSWHHRLWEGLRGQFETVDSWRFVAISAALLLALALPFSANWFQASTSGFHTVANPGSLDHYSNRDLRVVFDKNFSGKEMDTLLESLHASIVEEPNDNRVYTLRLGQGVRMEEALADLRKHKATLFAEPALPQARPQN